MNNGTIVNIFTGETRAINASTDLVAPWCLNLLRHEFVKLKVFSLMHKILTDCYRYSTPIANTDKEMSLFDSVVYKNAQYGLISFIAHLIATQGKQYLVYDNGIVRKATYAEQKLINADYKSGMTYKYGIIVDFSDYALGKLLTHYYHQIYTVEEANNNSIALGGSLQYKVADYRQKIGLNESLSDSIKAQAANICRYAKDGKPVVIDSQDSLEQTDSSRNIEVSRESKDKIYQELAAALGCTVSYIIGCDETTNGSGASYERLDGRNEDMIKGFWLTVFNPIVTALYGTKLKFVSQKWVIIKENLGSISMVEGLTSIPNDIKASVIAKLIGDNQSNPKDEVEKQILALLNNSESEIVEQDDEQ